MGDVTQTWRAPAASLGQLFGSKTRLRLLSLFLEFRDRRFFGSELTTLVRVRHSAVQRELRHLEELGLVKRTDGPYRIFYQADPGFPLFAELQQLLKRGRAISARKIATKSGNLRVGAGG